MVMSHKSDILQIIFTGYLQSVRQIGTNVCGFATADFPVEFEKEKKSGFQIHNFSAGNPQQNP